MGVDGVHTTLRCVGRMVTLDLWHLGNARRSVASSGVLLAVFLVLHACGNAGLLASRRAINTYGYVLHHKMAWGVLAFETYFFAGAMLHLLSAGWLAYSSGKLSTVLSKPWDWTVPHTFMAGTGSMALFFLVNHINDFKLGQYGAAQITDPITGLTTETEDIGGKVVMHLSQLEYCVFYLLSSWVITGHVYFGWRRAVVRPSAAIPAKHQATAVTLGNILLGCAATVYTAVPILSFLGWL